MEKRLRVLREVIGLAAPVALAGLLTLAFRIPVSSGEEERGEPVIPLCSKSHPDRGETRRVDLQAIKRGYADLKKQFSSSIEHVETDFSVAMERPYDLGLEACRWRNERRVELDPAAPPGLRGQRLYFMRGDRRQLPQSVADDPRVEILVVATPRLKDLGELAGRLKRSVGLAAPEYLKAFGVRCTDTLAEIEEDGRAVVLHEGD